ncbi:hypothetical protein [Bradyrhizobium zhanjiangense]|uniref:Uncharacterized protein n=1 Tax=Bradyrhizobium zhanjiangense TaxID=1325107 RepID=A0A4V1KVW4_9BRAD|nr:hypothetical protein [Bradyrhizobium zhanjiangense]RXG92618.1 hypothetical protein EAS61_23000 [Bradyrhizobium zhanjiangense]
MTLSYIGDIEFVGEVEWDGKAIVVGAATPFGHVSCRIPRETIHALPIYSDALEREIRLERHLILERLAPALRAKISISGTGEPVDLWPWEISRARPAAVASALPADQETAGRLPEAIEKVQPS